MTKEETGILIEKYLDGDTTNAEEQLLRQHFNDVSSADIPEEWRVYKALFAWETNCGAACRGVDRTVAAGSSEDMAARSPVKRRLNMLLTSAAASAAILMAVSVWHVPSAGRQCYAVIDGRIYTDNDVVEREAEEALSLVAGSCDDAFDALMMMRSCGGDITDDDE